MNDSDGPIPYYLFVPEMQIHVPEKFTRKVRLPKNLTNTAWNNR